MVQLKAGAAAPTGDEVAPTPDAGYSPAWIITVQHGDTAITSGDIAQHPDAPIIPTKLPDIVSYTGGTVEPSTSAPLMNGTASVGSQTKYARGDHRHPTDTSRAPLASPSFSGTPTAPTPSTGDNTTRIATTAFVVNKIASAVNLSLYAPLAGATFTGTVNVPDRPAGDNSNKAANTQYVDTAIDNIPAPAIHYYKTSGTFTLSVPSWAKHAEIRAWGGGAGGMSLNGSQELYGGSSGAYLEKMLAVSGGSIDIAIGGGASGHFAANSSDNGPDAGDTIIDYGATTLTASGAQGGLASGPSEGAPGTASGGDLNLTGMRGGNAWTAFSDSGFDRPSFVYAAGGSAPFGGAGGIQSSATSMNGQWPGGGGSGGRVGSVLGIGSGADGGAIIRFLPF